MSLNENATSFFYVDESEPVTEVYRRLGECGEKGDFLPAVLNGDLAIMVAGMKEKQAGIEHGDVMFDFQPRKNFYDQVVASLDIKFGLVVVNNVADIIVAYEMIIRAVLDVAVRKGSVQLKAVNVTAVKVEQDVTLLPVEYPAVYTPSQMIEMLENDDDGFQFVQQVLKGESEVHSESSACVFSGGYSFLLLYRFCDWKAILALVDSPLYTSETQRFLSSSFVPEYRRLVSLISTPFGWDIGLPYPDSVSLSVADLLTVLGSKKKIYSQRIPVASIPHFSCGVLGHWQMLNYLRSYSGSASVLGPVTSSVKRDRFGRNRRRMVTPRLSFDSYNKALSIVGKLLPPPNFLSPYTLSVATLYSDYYSAVLRDLSLDPLYDGYCYLLLFDPVHWKDLLTAGFGDIAQIGLLRNFAFEHQLRLAPWQLFVVSRPYDDVLHLKFPRSCSSTVSSPLSILSRSNISGIGSSSSVSTELSFLATARWLNSSVGMEQLYDFVSGSFFRVFPNTHSFLLLFPVGSWQQIYDKYSFSVKSSDLSDMVECYGLADNFNLSSRVSSQRYSVRLNGFASSSVVFHDFKETFSCSFF